MFGQAAYADITFSIQGVLLPAHRFVICPQSIYLKEVCQKAFSSNQRTLKFENESGAAHWRVFEYLYTGGYSDYLGNAELRGK